MVRYTPLWLMHPKYIYFLKKAPNLIIKRMPQHKISFFFFFNHKISKPQEIQYVCILKVYYLYISCLFFFIFYFFLLLIYLFILIKLDHEVGMCSLIPPAMAISDNTQQDDKGI